MRISKGSLRPNSEAPRRPWPVERGTTNYINSNVNKDSTAALRLQRLWPLGVTGSRAALLADLIWAEAPGDLRNGGVA